jgi:hypothetical protein
VGDFIRGYGQAVNLPANTTAGIPITLSSGVNVAAASVVLTYDPALLTITGGSSPIVGATAIIDTSVPGQVTINVTSAGQFSATAGVVTLVNLTANVPTTATYAAKNRLDLTVISLTDTVAAAIPTIADDGLHVSSYRGDLNGERTIGPGDGTLALRLQSGVLSTTGFTAFQQVDPYLISDMNDDGTATPGDITGLLRFQSGAAGGFNRIPALPTGLAPPTTFAADPQIFVPTTGLTAKVGEVLTVPIRIKVTESQGIDLAGLSIALAYDANQFTIANVRLGSALTNQGFLASFNTSVPGMMQLIAVSDLGPAFSMGDIGDLFLFDLTVQPTAATGDFALNLLATTNATDNNTDNLLLLPAIQDGWDVNDGVVQVSSANSLRSDINDDGTVDINDVVAAIFYFNHSAGVDLSQATAEVKRANVVPDAQLDILDLLTVIYDYNVSRQNGEGERSSANDPPSRADASLADEETEDIFAVLAADLDQRKRK